MGQNIFLKKLWQKFSILIGPYTLQLSRDFISLKIGKLLFFIFLYHIFQSASTNVQLESKKTFTRSMVGGKVSLNKLNDQCSLHLIPIL